MQQKKTLFKASFFFWVDSGALVRIMLAHKLALNALKVCRISSLSLKIIDFLGPCYWVLAKPLLTKRDDHRSSLLGG